MNLVAGLSFDTFLVERVPVRVLLSTIGSRGDVQPLVALALQLRELGQEVCICAPPDFREWIGTLGIPFVPVGREVRHAAAPSASGTQAPPTPEYFRQLMEETVSVQFEAITAAARGCDILVAGMALQFALHSVAEQMGIPYVYAAWSPVTLPSQYHAPPPLPAWAGPPKDGTADNRTLWLQDQNRWNDHWIAAINAHRAAAGLAPISDVRGHILYCSAMAGGRPDVGAMDSDCGSGCGSDRRLDWFGPETTVAGCGDVPQFRRAACLLRFWQHAGF